MLEQGMRIKQIREPSQDYQNVEIIVTMILYAALIQLVLMMGTVGFHSIIFIFHLLLANFQSYKWM